MNILKKKLKKCARSRSCLNILKKCATTCHEEAQENGRRSKKRANRGEYCGKNGDRTLAVGWRSRCGC